MFVGEVARAVPATSAREDSAALVARVARCTSSSVGCMDAAAYAQNASKMVSLVGFAGKGSHEAIWSAVLGKTVLPGEVAKFGRSLGPQVSCFEATSVEVRLRVQAASAHGVWGARSGTRRCLGFAGGRCLLVRFRGRRTLVFALLS